MKNLIHILFLFLPVVLFAQNYEPQPASRNPLKWPFSTTSIWNMPIGSNAEYTHAYIERATQAGMTIDEDYIVMTPAAPLMDIYWSNAGWNANGNRCLRNRDTPLASWPIPQDFIVSPQTWDGKTPNAGIAVLMPDGRTIKHSQPFAHCEEGGYATSQYMFDDADLYGDGYYGSHGGSKLSAIGGALRVGELTPTSGPIRHALKINLYGRKNIYYDSATRGYRWPAKAADSYASSAYYKDRKNPVVPDCRMGALFALPPSTTISSLNLETEPAKILALAFQDYGAYLVDDTAWDVWAIVTEWGPDGRFATEFRKDWGFSFSTGVNTAFGRDMIKIFTNLHVVTNNTAQSIGGGGTPRVPLAPPFGNTASISQPKEKTQIMFSVNENTIIFDENLTGEILILDCVGRVVAKKNMNNERSVDISHLTGGVYFLTHKTHSIKFVKN